MGQVFFDESYWDSAPSVLEPECGGSIDTLNFTFSGWGYWENRYSKPCVCRWHWLENKRMTHVCDRCTPALSAALTARDVRFRWSRDKTSDLQSAIFNGVGHALT